MSKQIGQYFKDDEFECHCRQCGFKLVHLGLVEILDLAREKLGVPLRINSGVRCPSYNKAVGGAQSSLHLPKLLHVNGGHLDLGLAADVTFARASLNQPINILRLYTTLEDVSRPTPIGLGLYSGFVHVDVRGTTGSDMPAARWQVNFPWPRL